MCVSVVEVSYAALQARAASDEGVLQAPDVVNQNRVESYAWRPARY